MQIGLNINGERIKPTETGQKAICQLCGGTLIGNCGSNYIHHWKHSIKDRNCDSWKEHETKWHRDWKANFPIECQEVIIDRDGEKHIADVKTLNGVVLEFQNSPISSSTIRIREVFYQNMIWVVNLKHIRENFSIHSLIEIHLKELKRTISKEYKYIENDYNQIFKDIHSEIELNEKILKTKLSKIANLKTIVEKLKLAIPRISEFSEQLISEWTNQKYYSFTDISEILHKVESIYKYKFQEVSKNFIENLKKINSCEISLNEIAKLEDIPVDTKLFKIVGFKHLTESNFQIARAILKTTTRTAFPDVIEIRTLSEYQKYKDIQTKYDFAIDPTRAIDSFNRKIETLKEANLSLENELILLRPELSKLLSIELSGKIENTDTEINSLLDEVKNLRIQIDFLTNKITRMTEQEERDRSEYILEIENKEREKKAKIEEEKKGLYAYQWKHKRPSWLVSERKIYFDFGKDILFQRINKSTLKKVTIEEFLEEHLNFN